MFNTFHKSVFVPQDVSPEAKSLIEKYKDKSASWQKDLGKELIKYIERPDLVLQVLRQLAYINHLYPFYISSQFIESAADGEIQKLTETKYGNLVLNRIFSIFLYAQTKLPASETSKITKLIMRIEGIRVRINVNDKRPLIADMVENGDGLQLLRVERSLDDTWLLDQNAYRFGTGHDGEHILGNQDGSRVKAIAGLTGVVLTYYSQNDGTFAVDILLKDNKTVLVIKDLINLSLLIKSAPCSTKGLVKDNNGIPKFIDKNGRPISKVKIGVGETIGYTRKWSGKENKGATGMHFTVVKYEFIQQFREALGAGVNSASDYPNWFILPCGSESPVRCK